MKGWIGIVLTAAAAIAVTWTASPWVRMAVPIAGLMLAFKLYVLRLSGVRLRTPRLLGFIFLWPGMDPVPFTRTEPRGLDLRLLGWGLLNMAAGLSLILIVRKGRWSTQGCHHRKAPRGVASRLWRRFGPNGSTPTPTGVGCSPSTRSHLYVFM